MDSPGKDYFVFVGNFGSGKTELALHTARAAAKAGNPATLVDMDVVNPYFRAAERKAELEKEGVELISPNFATANVEIITVNPKVYSAFVPGSGAVVFDVGGDGIGARAIGQYKPYFDRIPQEKLRVWLVINIHRPLSATAERIEDMFSRIENASRLSIGGLINNSNMSYETEGSHIAAGYEVIRQVSIDTGLPVVMTSGEEEPLAQFRRIVKENALDEAYIGQIVPIHTLMHRDWERFVKLGF